MPAQQLEIVRSTPYQKSRGTCQSTMLRFSDNVHHVEPSKDIERLRRFNEIFGRTVPSSVRHTGNHDDANGKENIVHRNDGVQLAQLQRELREAAVERIFGFSKSPGISRSRSFGSSSERSRPEMRRPEFAKVRRSSTVRSDRPTLSSGTFEQPSRACFVGI